MFGRFSARRAHSVEVFELVLALKAKVRLLEERADAMEAAQERLRGRLYGTGAHKTPPDAPPRPVSKGEVLRDYFTPGRPAKHE